MKNRKPAWWALYLLVPVMFGLMFLVHSENLAPGWEEAEDGLVVFLTFAGMALWASMNAGALARMDNERAHGMEAYKFTVYPPRSELLKASAGATPHEAPAQPEAERKSEKWSVN